MDKVHEIMERLGFKEDGSESTKAAFVKNLIKQAYGFDAEIPAPYKKPEQLQLSFDLTVEDATG